MSEVTPECDPPREPNAWQSWGWLMPGIWLLFLIYTVVAVLEAGLAPWLTAAGLALIVAYSLVYLAGFNVLMGGVLRRWAFPGWRWAVFGALWLCIALQYALVGNGAVNMTPFTLAFVAYMFERWKAWLIALATITTVSALAWFREPGSFWYVLLITTGVFLVCMVMRALIEADERATNTRRDLAVVSERERVARDVHDGLGHSLTVVAMKAELAERVMDADPARAKAELADLRRLTRDALDQVRATVGGLRAVDLPTQVAALQLTLQGAGIDVQVEGEPTAVGTALQPALSWVLREAGTNVLRHAAASRCTISFAPGRLVVTDDGVGLGGAPAGHGRRGMAERLAAVGAELEVAGAPGGGTSVAVTW